jgi:hypothetical protein
MPQANTMSSTVPQQQAVGVPPPNIRDTGSSSVLAALDTLTVSLDKIQTGPHQPVLAYDKNGVRVLIYTAKVKSSHVSLLCNVK